MTLRSRPLMTLSTRPAVVVSAPPMAPEQALLEAEALATAALARAEAGLDDGSWKGLSDAEEAAWSVLGAVECGRLAFARAVLERLLDSQQADGRLQATMEQPGPRLGRWLGWLGRRRRPRHTCEEASRSLRATAMVAWACAEFAVRTGDTEFGRRWAVALDAAIAWIDTHVQRACAGIGLEATYHLAQMALGQLSIASGDAVEGARRWAAAAGAKARLAESVTATAPTDRDLLLAIGVGGCDRRVACEALAQAGLPCDAGLRAWAATVVGETSLAHAALVEAAQAAVGQGGFTSFGEAGRFLRGLTGWKRLAAVPPAGAPCRQPRQWLLSEDEARILTVC